MARTWSLVLMTLAGFTGCGTAPTEVMSRPGWQPPVDIADAGEAARLAYGGPWVSRIALSMQADGTALAVWENHPRPGPNAVVSASFSPEAGWATPIVLGEAEAYEDVGAPTIDAEGGRAVVSWGSDDLVRAAQLQGGAWAAAQTLQRERSIDIRSGPAIHGCLRVLCESTPGLPILLAEGGFVSWQQVTAYDPGTGIPAISHLGVTLDRQGLAGEPQVLGTASSYLTTFALGRSGDRLFVYQATPEGARLEGGWPERDPSVPPLVRSSPFRFTTNRRGEALAFWSCDADPGRSCGRRFRRQVWEREVMFTDESAGVSTPVWESPIVALADNGTIVTTWPSGVRRVQRCPDASPLPQDVVGGESYGSPSLAVNGRGDVLLGWLDSEGSVQVAHSNAGGRFQTSTIGALGRSYGSALVGYGMPALALEESGRGLALWYSHDALGDFPRPGDETSLRVRTRSLLP